MNKPSRKQQHLTRDENFNVVAFLETLATIIPSIARGIGPDCEVAFHDNRTKPQRILAIGNGHVTGRKVGDLMTKITIDENELDELQEPLFNYPSIAPNGSQLRVTLIPIRHNRRTIAYIAINYMLDNLLAAQRVLGQLTSMEPHREAIQETFVPVGMSLSGALDECLSQFPKAPRQLNRPERIDLVGRLSNRGVFQIRGAAKELALRLGVSRAAIYEHLQVAENSQ